MPEIERVGDEVTLRMRYEEYRDLTESLTAAGNDAWRHRDCAAVNVFQHIRASHAEAAWEWSRGMGIPPIKDGERKTFHLEPFKHLKSVPGGHTQEQVMPDEEMNR